MRGRKPARGDTHHLAPASGISGGGTGRSHGPFTMIDIDLLRGYSSNDGIGNSQGPTSVPTYVTYLDWTDRAKVCDPAEVSVTDPMLVVRRHVDLLRVHSAICRLAR
jgi:hypothetical protein